MHAYLCADDVLGPLKRISPGLQHIKLDKKKAEAFPELLKVLECHSRSSDFMIQFFKQPLIENCDCKACSDCLFNDVRMSPSVFKQIMDFTMPMPIPKPIKIWDTSDDLEYMSFADAKLLPFTDKHQPSLAVVAARTTEAAKKKAALNNSELGSSRVANSIAPNITTLKKRNAFIIAHIKRVRGAVVCNNCLRSRCIYSGSVVSRMRPPPPTPLMVRIDY